MPTSCPDACGGYTLAQWVSLGAEEQARQAYCALTTGPVDPVPPIYGTTVFGGGTATNSAIVIPEGYSSFAVANSPESTDPVTVGSVSLGPGFSIGHGIEDGYPGEELTVTSPNATTSALVTYTQSVPSP